MNKIRVIDLLNKIANGEEVPKMVTANKFEDCEDMIFIYDKDIQDYKTKDEDFLFEMLFNKSFPILNEELEIIDEEDEFIEIEEIKHEYIYGLTANEEKIDDRISKFEDKINDLIKNQKKIIERLNK